MPKAAAKNGIAHGGTIHRIEDAPLKPDQDFWCQLSPGLEYDWENGRWDAARQRWFRRDGSPMKPTHFCLLPGEKIRLEG